MWKFKDEDIVALQNRASDLWEESPAKANHAEYIATANRLLGALEMFWHSAEVEKDVEI